MTIAELIEATKELADDDRAGGLWTTEALTRYANEGEREAAARARLILDHDTANTGGMAPVPVCTYTVATGDSTITLHPKIIFVRRVKVASLPIPLPATHLKDMDAYNPGWESHANGSVVTYIPNWSKAKLRFYNKFPATDSVNLQVIRLPLNDMADEADEPEIEERFHMGLVNYMLYRAFTKPDPETKDKVKAEEYYALFEQQFGPRSSAVDEVWIQREHGYDPLEGLY